MIMPHFLINQMLLTLPPTYLIDLFWDILGGGGIKHILSNKFGRAFITVIYSFNPQILMKKLPTTQKVPFQMLAIVASEKDTYLFSEYMAYWKDKQMNYKVWQVLWRKPVRTWDRNQVREKIQL